MTVIIITFLCVGRNTKWNKYVREQIKQWNGYFREWLADGIKKGHPVHVVKYEDLKLDTLKEVRGMLDFLHFKYEENDLEARINTSFNTFHRLVCIY